MITDSSYVRTEPYAADRIQVLGIPFDCMDMAALVRSVEEFIERGEKFTIAFSNPEFLLESRRNHALQDYLRRCHYNVADGVGVLWASRLLHSRSMPERVTGTDFVPRLCELSLRNGYGIFLLGGQRGVADRAKRNLEIMYPGVRIVGARHGFFNDSESIIAEINNSGAHILMVCMGNPKQEEWIAKHLDKLNVRLAFGNGGALDFWSGDVKRAPRWVIRLNLEWLHRLWQDRSLRRLRRQLRLALFVSLVMVEKLRLRND